MLLVNSIIFTIMLVLAVMSGFISSMIRGEYVSAVETEDDNPPQIMDIKVDALTASSAVIQWKTDEKADSLVNYSLDKSYGIVRDSDTEKTDHELPLSSLLPDTTYFFRIISSDKGGNQGISNDFIFTTPKAGEEEDAEGEQPKKPGEGEENAEGSGRGEGTSGETGQGKNEGQAGTEGEGKDAGDKQIEGQGQGEQETPQTPQIQQILEALENIKDIKTLEMITSKVESVAQTTVSDSPFIIEGVPEVVEVGTDYVTIAWRTSLEANSIVALASERAFNPDITDPYSWKEGEPDAYVQVHEVTINGLEASTVYHYQAQSRNRVGLTAKSEDRTFSTKSIKPEIFNINIEKLEEEAATLVWYTNVPCSSIVDYTNLENGETKSEGNPNYVTRHSIRLANLKFDTTYAAIIRVENEYGEKNSSAPVTFTTVKDIVPPVISKVATESTIYPGADAKIQTIINWDTDELSTCQFFYHQGLFSKGEENSLTEELNFSTKHIQVAVVFQPATVYKFWIKCKDKTGNSSRSDDFTLLTPQKEQSIIDIIIANFQSTFGWLKKIGK